MVGAPVRWYFLEQLERMPASALRDIKLAIVLSPMAVSPALAASIKTRLATKNRTLVFTYAAGLLTEEAWYYVQSEFKHNAFYAPEEIDREVLRITFDEEGLVENIERFGLEEGEVVVLSRRVTTSNTAGVSFLKQLLGNLGKINAENLFGS